MQKIKKSLIQLEPLFFIILTLFVVKFQLLDLPFYYEEKPYTIKNVDQFSYFDIFTSNFFSNEFASHQPILPIITNMWTKIFGLTPMAVHVFILLISALGLFSSAKIYERYSNSNNIIFYFPVLLILSSPSIFIHLSNYRYDIFAMSIAVIYICSRIYKKIWIYFISGLILAYSRETVLAFLTGMFIFEIYFRKKTKYLLISIIHLALWATYFLINKVVHGSLSTSVAKNQLVNNFSEYLEILAFDLNWVFVEEFRFILTGLSIISLLKYRDFKSKSLFFLLPVIFYCFGLSIHSIKAEYYLFPALPFVYIFCAIHIRKLFSQRVLFGLSVIFVGLSVFGNIKNGQKQMAENSYLYSDIVNNYKETLNYISSELPQKVLNMEWPLMYYAEDVTYGYLKSPLENKIISIAESKNIWASQLGHKLVEDKNCFDVEVVVVAKHSNELQKSFQQKLIENCNGKLLKTLKSGISETYIYSLSY